MATYQRPRSTVQLNKTEREELLKDYLDYYRSVARTRPDLLDIKIDNTTFDKLLDRIGGLLIEETASLANSTGPVSEFLDTNPLPPSVAAYLPPNFRAFCLGLNALKVWVSAEQQATDRFLLRGRARDELRAVTGRCIITDQLFTDVRIELHHPARDGRPPIPLSPEGHKKVGQKSSTHAERPNTELTASEQKIYEISSNQRGKNGRSSSNLRKACQELTQAGPDPARVAISVAHGTRKVGASSRTFARNVQREAKCEYAQILAVLDKLQLGLSAPPHGGEAYKDEDA